MPETENGGATAGAPLRAGLGPLEVGAVEVTGEDRVSYLQSVLTQHLAEMAPATHRGALHLDQHGAPLALLDVVVLDERIVLVAPERELAEEVAERLGSRTFLADARFAVLDVTGRALRGEEADAVAAEVDLAVPAGTVGDADGALVLGREGGIDLVGPADPVSAAADGLVHAGAEEVDAAAIEAWRIARGVPAWAREIRRPHLPEEAGVLPTHVHLAKGCYPGQEAIARMWMLGRPRRRLARVRLADHVEAGWEGGSGRERVEVTSAASYAGERVGLAYIPPDAEPGQRFGDGAVTVRDLVGEGVPVPGHEEGVARRRDRR